MEASIRLAGVPSLVAAVAFILTPLTSPAALPPHAPPVVLTAVTGQVPVVANGPVGFINQEVAFNVRILRDWVTTGEQLFVSELPIPMNLLTNIRNGVPVLTALGRAVQDLVGTELIAGRDLVGFAGAYLGFQFRLVSAQFSGLRALLPGVKPAAALPTHRLLPLTAVGTGHPPLPGSKDRNVLASAQPSSVSHDNDSHKHVMGSNLIHRPHRH